MHQDFTDIGWVKAVGNKVVFRGQSELAPQSIVLLDPGNNQVSILDKSTAIEIDPSTISTPKLIEYRSANDRNCYGLYYPAKNKHYTAGPNEKPPLIIKVHGGPTGCAYPELNLEYQFWTSRGFAILDVNYGGSSGFGREYRERLGGNWGVVDVEDCAYGALHLVASGEVDKQRLIISGGSAGGFTVLSALTFKNVFKAGASYFGIGDLEAMTNDTHKFESRYLEKLIGAYPKERQIYRQRSPIDHVDQLSCPIIFFQGLEDKIVPPSQTETMVQALRSKGIPVACLMFAGEQHGFRQGETIRRCLDGELYFYAKVFGFALPEGIMSVEIENLSNTAK